MSRYARWCRKTHRENGGKEDKHCEKLDEKYQEDDDGMKSRDDKRSEESRIE